MARSSTGFHIEMHMTERFALVGALVDKGAKAQARKAAYAMRDRAKDLVHKRTYALHDSIEVQRVDGGEYEVSAGDDEVDYAAAVEFGTYKMPAKPYFTPALEAGRKIMRDGPEKKL